MLVELTAQQLEDVFGGRPYSVEGRGVYSCHNTDNTYNPFSVFELTKDCTTLEEKYDIIVAQNFSGRGLCDNVEQILKACPQIVEDEAEYFINICGMSDGFRWHKHGEYIGVHEPSGETYNEELDKIKILRFEVLALRYS